MTQYVIQNGAGFDIIVDITVKELPNGKFGLTVDTQHSSNALEFCELMESEFSNNPDTVGLANAAQVFKDALLQQQGNVPNLKPLSPDEAAAAAQTVITDFVQQCRSEPPPPHPAVSLLLGGFSFPALPSFHDPLVLDLQGTGLQLTSVTNSQAYFDFNNSGTATQTGWITPGEGLLLINNGSGNLSQELLGAQSGNGFTDLQALDSNGDGVIKSQDFAFSSLEVWVDQNANGQVDLGEIETLSQLGITSISLTTTAANGNINGNIVVSDATFSGGSNDTGTISEVDFQTSASHERYVPPAGFSYSSEALMLPQLVGYGSVSDLQVAMSQDSSLLANVQSLVLNASSMSGADFDSAFQDIMLEWAGVSNVALDAYGADINSQHYAFICAIYGVTPAPQGDWAGIPSATIEGMYRSLIDQLELRFSSQVAASEATLGVTVSSADPFESFTAITWDPTSDNVVVDPNLLMSAIVQGAPTGQSDAEAYYGLAFAAVRGLNTTVFGGDTGAFAASLLSNLGAIGVDANLQQIALGAIGFTSVVDEASETGAITLSSVNGAVFVGTGDKNISGGSGDVYVYTSAGGNDTISDLGQDAQLVLSDIPSTGVTIERPNGANDLLVVNTATGADLTIAGYFVDANFENVAFSDGVELTVGETEQFLRSEAIAYLTSSAALADTVSQEETQLALFGFTSTIAEGSQTGTVLGTAAVDVLLIGTGDKTVDGGGAADIYLYSASGGDVDINEQGNNESSLAMNGIASIDVAISRLDGGNDLIITDTVTGETVTILGEFVDHGPLSTITFADGVTWTYDQVEQMLLDQESATPGESIYGYEHRNDTLVAGTGDRYMGGEGGTDTYVYSSAGGNDVVDDTGNLFGGLSTLEFSDIASTDVTLSRLDGDSDLVITVTSTGKTVTVHNEFFWTSDGSLAAITFSDGVIWTLGQVKQMVLNQESAANGGSVYGYYGTDTLVAGLGDKYLNGEGGADTYVYSSTGGNDVIDDTSNTFGGVSNLVLTDIASTGVTLSRPGGDSDLVIAVTATGKTVTVDNEFFWTGRGSLNTITFSDGVTWTLQQVEQALLNQESAATGGSVYGYYGTDTLVAGLGDKYLNGQGGADTYVYSSSGGNDEIDDTSNFFGGISNLVFSDIASTGVTLSRPDGAANLVIKVTATGKTVTVDNDLGWTGEGSLSSISFSDGVTWTLQQVKQALLDQESAANGGSVYGYFGADTLIAGLGDKYLNGQGGADTYVYSLSGGNDEIDDTSNFSGGISSLVFSDIASTSVTLSRPNGAADLVITVTATDKTLTLDNELGWTGQGSLSSISFSDGVSWTVPQIEQMLLSQESAASSGTIYGFSGSDTLVAGLGNKTLNGEGGADTFVYSSAGGDDIVIGENQGTLQFSDIASTGVTLSRPGNAGDLVITVNSTGKTVTVQGEFANDQSLAAIKFSDGVGLTAAQIEAILTIGGTGSPGSPFIRGQGPLTLSASSSVVEMGAGIAASDILLQSNSFGDMTVALRGDPSDYITVYGDLSDQAWGVSSRLKLIEFSDGTSMEIGEPAAGQGLPLSFTWVGNVANYSLTGASYGSNTFEITAGNGSITFGNTSKGGNGQNTVEFGEGDGEATISLNGATGTIAFGAGITAQDVYWQTNGFGDLTIKILNDTADSIVIYGDLVDTAGTVTSGVNELTFSDGSIVYLGQGLPQGGPLTFTWLGNTAGYSLTGASYGSNIFEITAANGSIGFGNTSKGGNGQNIVDFADGDGNVSISLNGGTGTIAFGAGITAQDVYLQADGFGNLSIKLLNDATDSISIYSDLVDNAWGVSSGIAQLTFNDGTALSIGEPAANQGAPISFTWFGTSGSSTSGIGFGANTFELGAGSEAFTGGNTGRGGNGNNTYVASAGTGQATINPNEAAGTTNELDFSGNITDENLWFVQSGNNLKIDLLGTTTSVTVNGWFSSSSGQLQEITAGGLKIDSQVSQLVQAMATYSANNAGFDPTSSSISTVPQNTGLQTSLAAAWHG